MTGPKLNEAQTPSMARAGERSGTKAVDSTVVDWLIGQFLSIFRFQGGRPVSQVFGYAKPFGLGLPLPRPRGTLPRGHVGSSSPSFRLERRLGFLDP